jgi:predicted signal transduction protein with EAL and GGDEF domain
VLQSGRTQPAAATDLARRIIEAVGRPFELHGHQVVTGATIGIAFAPEDGDDPDRLLKNADMALYRAKGAGRGTHSFFEPSMDANMQARRRVEMGLRRALAHDEFELHYQPVVNLRDNAITGFEALLRWNDPQRGLISPAEFIPVAEDTGLIIPIGDWVIRHACAEAATWPGDLTVAVNLSPAQFRGHRLTHVVFAALAEARLPARRLELEITESVLLNNNEATLATLHQLRDFGARISMDDFGTGYSSLSYLRSFPFDKIKIDQSFIRDLGGSDDSLAIVRAVTGLGAALGMRTTAEGVETAEQLEYLRREGCTEVQGFLFSRPRPSAELFPDRIPLADVAA